MSEQGRKRLGSNMRERRRTLGVSQEELADIAGLHRTYIGAVERGERNVSIDNIIVIAKALNVKIAQLLDGVD
jgi:transcriptional regulator with XRE-family HTH domain